MSGKQRETRQSRRARQNDIASTAAARPLRVGLISLGCPKNLVDSEVILGKAAGAGLEVTADVEACDIVVVNTCSFIDSAKEESVQTILEACERKRAPGGPGKVVVTGCMAQRYGEALRDEIPEVDAIVGLGQYDDIGEVLYGLMGDSGNFYRVQDPDFACNAEIGRLRLTPQHFAYLRISEGCDNPCTFCAIPSIRGGFRSKPIPQIVEETHELVDRGAEEIVVISQDTTSYGVDLDGRYRLPELLESVAGVPGVRWIRLLYVYPTCFSESMIDAVASIPQVLPYVDIPLQHISDSMLRRMGRRSDERQTRALLERMRERIPGLYLRTTFIVGFPGEDAREFETLRRFVEEFRFERLGVFPYSPEENTPAFKMKDTVPAEVIKERHHELMLTQQPIAFEQGRGRVGDVLEVAIDGHDGESWLARSFGEAPEIDPVIFIPDDRGEVQRHSEGGTFVDIASLQDRSHFGKLGIGKFARIRVTAARGYDLVAEPLH